MKTKYKFITDIDPTDAELAEIISDARNSAMEKALKAQKEFMATLNEYLKTTMAKYSKTIKLNESAT